MKFSCNQYKGIKIAFPKAYGQPLEQTESSQSMFYELALFEGSRLRSLQPQQPLPSVPSQQPEAKHQPNLSDAERHEMLTALRT